MSCLIRVRRVYILTIYLVSINFGSVTSLVTAQELPQRAEYFSYVNWDYQHRNELMGWKNSAALVRATLQEWGYTVDSKKVENTGAEGMDLFQQTVATQRSEGLKLVYLASHQTPSGRIDYPDKTKAHWSQALNLHEKDSGNPSIMLLDLCHADVIPHTRMEGKVPFHFLLSAAAANEETYELRMFARRPVDFRRRFRDEVEWMKEQLGPKWKGEVSFAGFLWVRQFLKTPQAPQSHADWKEFLKGMEQEAADFARDRSRYLSSSLALWE
ncbi:MAG: hypothetical protein AAF571_12935 [Verrucomicrobiota bacterium]